MKDFQEFISSLSKDDIDWICGVNDNSDKLSISLSDPDAGNQIASFIVGQNISINLRLLQKYHEWLSAQLAK